MNLSEEKVRIYVTKDDKITVCENNLVNLTLKDGTVLEKLEPRRLFPVSRANEYITLLNTDGKEAALIRCLSDLDESSLETVTYSLNDYYLVPHIVRILSVSEKYGALRWCVETDRGISEFEIRNRNSDVKVYTDGRVRLRDSNDNRYVITDYRKLDGRSKSFLIADL